MPSTQGRNINPVRVLYAGSFDPFHEGHLGIVETAAALLDEVVVAAVGNPRKPLRTPLETRAAAIRPKVSHLLNVEVVWHNGLTTDLAMNLEVDALIRGVSREHRNEFQMAYMNLTTTGIQTLFLPAAASTRHTSSTVLRSIGIRSL